jgi:iron(III) transport system permease protein
VLTVVVALVALVFLAPFAYLVLEAVGSGTRFFEVLTSESIRRPLVNSLSLALSVSLTCAVLGTLLAIMVMRTDLPWRRGYRLLLALPLVMPSFVAATAFVAAFGPGGLISSIPRPEGFWGAYVVLTLLSYPYVYLPVTGRLSSTSPSTEEASRLLGRGPVRTLLRVLLPQLRPAALGGALLVFLYVLSDFGAVSLLRYDTITRVLYSSRLLDPELSLTLGLLLGVLALMAALAAARIAGEDVSSRRSGRLPRYALRGWRWPSCLLVALPVVAGLAAPIVVFVAWVLRGTATVGSATPGLGTISASSSSRRSARQWRRLPPRWPRWWSYCRSHTCRFVDRRGGPACPLRWWPRCSRCPESSSRWPWLRGR